MFCEPYPDLVYLFFSSHAPRLLYYSHFTAIIVSLLLSGFVLINNRKDLSAKILAAISGLFSVWTIIDLFIWTLIDSAWIMYLWSFWFTIFSLIFLLTFYFLYTFIKKTDVLLKWKVFWLILISPIIIFSSTAFNLESFDVYGCNAIENQVMINYTYTLSVLIFLGIIYFAIHQYRKAEITKKKEILYSSIGVSLFLLSFSIATYIASVLNLLQSSQDTFNIEQYGYFGMTIFIAFLAYLIVRFKAFNIKLIGAQALIITMVILIGSQFFFIRNNTNRILTAITLIILGIVGINLIRSVKREVVLRESLQTANAGQASLIHFMNHQIKGRFGNIKNIFAELLTGDYGAVSEEGVLYLKKGYEETEVGVSYVTGILKGASAENGTLTFEIKPMNFRDLVSDVVGKQKVYSDNKGLSLALTVQDGDYSISGDYVQLWEAVKNLVDNAINYTIQGSVNVDLSIEANKFLLKIHDSGVGITDEDKARLFTAGGRGANSLKVNVNATGYGLVFVKNVATAHKGRVWAESAGHDKGSTFYLEIPKA